MRFGAKMHGVTLMELMIVVVIIGLLATMAYPNYRQYAARAKRNEAKAALLQVASMQERVYLQENSYTNDMLKLGFLVATNYITDSDSYTVTVTGASPANYTATATYRNADEEASKCATFQIDGNMVKTSAPDTDCWTRTR